MFPKRSFTTTPISNDDKWCARSDCFYKSYLRNRSAKSRAKSKKENGHGLALPPEPVWRPQRQHLDRYCTSPEALCSLLSALTITGRAADICGGKRDTVAMTLDKQCEVIFTNDINPW